MVAGNPYAEGSLQPVPYAYWRGEALIKLLEFVPVEEWLAHLACFMAEGAVWIDSDSGVVCEEAHREQAAALATRFLRWPSNQARPNSDSVAATLASASFHRASCYPVLVG